MSDRLTERVRAFASRHKGLLIAAGLAMLFFVIQFSWMNQYGATWDEPLHRNWGKLFYIYYRTGDRNFLELMPGHGIQYGPLYYVVNYLLSEKLYQAHLLTYLASNHLLNIITASVGVFATFLLAKNLRGTRLALLAVVFLVFFPLFIAHAHYNPKDIPLMTAVLITTSVFEIALRTGGRRYFILAGFLLGVSVAFKVSALLMLPAYGITYLVMLIADHDTTIPVSHVIRREALTVVFAAIAGAVGVFLAWPSAWGDITLIPRSILFFLQSDFWPGHVLFFGTEYSGAELPWFYTPLEYLMAMPVLMGLALIVGIVVTVQRLRRSGKKATDTLLLLWLLIPMFLSMKPGLVRYDGMRQFFFCLPAIAILAAIGFDRFLAWTMTVTKKKILVAVLCCGVLAASLLHEVWIIHPFEGSYRNEAVRVTLGHDLDQKLQIEYWGATYKQGMEWLTANAGPNPVICVPTAGVLVTWYPWRDDFTFECTPKSDYVMFFTRYSEAGAYALQTMPPVFMVQRMHSDLLKIYKIK